MTAPAESAENTGKKSKKSLLLRIALWTGGIGALLFLIAAAAVALTLDRIVKQGVEIAGTRLALVPVSVDGVHIGLVSGSANFKNLVVGNPEGYQSAFSVKIGEAKFKVDRGTLLSDRIIVRSVQLKAVEVMLECGLAGNNLSKIQHNLKSPPQADGVSVTNIPVSQGGVETKRTLEIDDLSISGAKVHLKLVDLGGEELTVPLPEIHLTDLGKGNGGVTPAEVSRRVFEAIKSGSEAAAKSAIANAGKGKFEKLTSRLRDLFR